MENFDWRGKKVLVTGADGFIGSHLVERVLQEGSSVRAFVFYNSFNSWGWLDMLPREVLSHIEVVQGDIRDPHGVHSAVRGTDTILHLASLIAIPFSYHSPDAYVDTNIKGALNILQAARAEGSRRVVITSTSEVYGTAQYVPIDEKHPHQGQSPYAASKIGADRVAESFYRSFDTPVVIARPFNTYGPRQSARAVIPTIITQLLRGVTELRLGTLTPTRDFNYVDDTVAGLMALAACDAAVGKEVNIGSGREISIGDLAQELMRQIGVTVPIAGEDIRTRPVKSEVERLLCNHQLIHQLTGWKSCVALEEGLARTVEWFRDPENTKRYKHDIYNI